MNYIYLYDNTFINLLNLIKFLIIKKTVPHNIKDISYQPTLFEETIHLNIFEEENTIEEFLKIFGSKVFNMIYYVFLSSNENKEIIIFYFLVNYLKHNNKVFYLRNNKSVYEALKIAKYVSRENHKFKGFLRFKEINNNILYAEFAPENNIIFLLSKHFKNRLKNERWIIKDVKRNILSIYDKKEFYIVNGEDLNIIINNSDDEIFIEDLWKSFYKTIGIETRKNDRCRINFMPKKYWQYITEVMEEYETSSK